MSAINDALIPGYIIIFVLSVFGNTLFLFAVKKNIKLQTPSFLLLSNACLSDLIFILLTVFTGVRWLMQEWIFGDVFCRLQSTLMEICIVVSALSLSAVAIERYWQICKMKNWIKVSQVRNTCLCIWFIALSVNSPLFYAYQQYPTMKSNETIYDEIRRNSTERTTYQCHLGNYYTYWKQHAALIFRCVSFIVMYVVPLVVMIFFYTKVVIALRKTSTSTIYQNDMVRVGNTAGGGSGSNKNTGKNTGKNTRLIFIVELLIIINKEI